MTIEREKYLSHIDDIDDIAEMRKILDKIEIVLRDHTVESTEFLDPWTIKLSKSILNRFQDISYIELGGTEEAERKVIMIYPDYYYLNTDEYSITALRLEGEVDPLTHRDFLGAVLSVGINRDRVGDILVHGEHVDIIVKEEMKLFILLNLEKIGNKNFEIKEISLEDIKPVTPEYTEKYQTLSSKRLDVYISAAYNLSRKNSLGLIQSGLAKVNWEQIKNPSYEINEGDMISVRGYGRSFFYSIDGLSRKGRLKANIRILI